jgi:hypothetical protein
MVGSGMQQARKLCEEQTVAAGKNGKDGPRSRGGSLGLRFGDVGTHRVTSTEGRSLNKPHERSPEPLLFRQQVVAGAAQCQRRGRLFGGPARSSNGRQVGNGVCGAAEAALNRRLVGCEPGRERPTTHNRRFLDSFAISALALSQPEKVP